ncbi:LptA/OstA family protein [Pontiellaceae bacterium B12227]|nr:LptA/OstA family protein [Pontiellaceae bacterium B12227]
MIRNLSCFLLSMILLTSCSKRERSDPDDEEWAEIEALADDAVTVPGIGTTTTNMVPSFGHVDAGEFDPFIQRLAAMKSVVRTSGQTLLTGERLVLDHDLRYVRMEQHVVVEDDQGVLTTESLIGRFSVSNEVEFVEASGGVDLVSSNRTASAHQAIYNYRSGFVQLEGQAAASDGGNRLSGERIQLWIKGDRKMICEPNALLEISETSGLELEGVGGTSAEKTEVRGDRVVYDESKGMAELIGNVRVRDPRAALNCENIRIYLKDDNEIDWIEASGEVIIQSDETKALAQRATYEAEEGKFALEGESMIKQGPHVLTGDRILFWHETQRMVCEPNARALLHIPDDIKAKFLKDLDE